MKQESLLKTVLSGGLLQSPPICMHMLDFARIWYCYGDGNHTTTVTYGLQCNYTWWYFYLYVQDDGKSWQPMPFLLQGPDLQNSISWELASSNGEEKLVMQRISWECRLRVISDWSVTITREMFVWLVSFFFFSIGFNVLEQKEVVSSAMEQLQYKLKVFLEILSRELCGWHLIMSNGAERAGKTLPSAGAVHSLA